MAPSPRPYRPPSTPTAGRDHAVSLNTEAVHIEVVAALLIEEGVKVERHQVVLHRAVPLHAIRPHDFRILVVGVKGEVQFLRVVGDVDVRGLAGRGAVQGRLLCKFGHVGCGGPDRVIQHPVDFGRCVGACWRHPRPTGHETQIFGLRELEYGLRGRGRHGNRRGTLGLGGHLCGELRGRAQAERGCEGERGERKERPGIDVLHEDLALEAWSSAPSASRRDRCTHRLD